MGFNLQDYEPVELRLARFWEKYPNGAVATELVFQDETRFIVKATVFANREDTFTNLLATGFAEERVDSNPKRVNFASALENCETSAIGRALANANFATKGQRPSREEMTKVVNRQQAAQTATPAHAELRTLLSQWSDDVQKRAEFVKNFLQRDIASLTELSSEEIQDVTTALRTVIDGRTTLEEGNE